MPQTQRSNPRKNIITIAGRPGSGKSTAAKEVAFHLGFRHFSSGDLYRELAHNQGIELLQANATASAHDYLDPIVDAKLREIGEKDDKLVIDSRLAWHWIPVSFKVFLDLKIEIAAQRILKEISSDRLKNERIVEDPDEYAAVLNERLKIETKRYQSKYGLELYDMNNYDLVVDTGENSLNQVREIVVRGFKDWLSK